VAVDHFFGEIQSALEKAAGFGLPRKNVHLIVDRDLDALARQGTDQESVDAVVKQGAFGGRFVEVEGSDESSEQQSFRE